MASLRSPRYKRLLSRPLLNRRWRPLLLSIIALFTLLEILFLSPSAVEEGGKKTGLDPEVFIPEKNRTLATGIPKDKVPDYTVEKFSYISTQGPEKEWKLDSNQAYLFNHEKLVHAKKVKVFLYDSQGKITVVTGKEAKYVMGDKNLEIYGDVKTVFPDGFELNSNYLHYRPLEKSISIPVREPVQGRGKKISFQSQGLEFEMKKGEILLPQSARVSTESPSGEKTSIESDRCLILRKEQTAHFMMHSYRPLASRFIQINQPSLVVRARKVDLHYGDASQLLNYLIAYEDVLIQEVRSEKKELTASKLKYATSGRASFDRKKNLITLTEFPQVYQDNDTVTGDVILLHWDTDVVEVEHSNAFSQGQQ